MITVQHPVAIVPDWASQQLGPVEIEADVRQGTQRDAVLFSVGAFTLSIIIITSSRVCRMWITSAPGK